MMKIVLYISVSCVLVGSICIAENGVSEEYNIYRNQVSYIMEMGASDGSDMLVCGLNSLYIYGVLNSNTNTLNSLRKIVPVTELGTSMLELKRAAYMMGIPSKIIKCETNRVSYLRLPAIIPIEPILGGLSHYVVVYKISKEYTYIIDSSNGDMCKYNLEDLITQTWKGYALIPEDKSTTSVVGVLILVCILYASKSLTKYCNKRKKNLL